MSRSVVVTLGCCLLAALLALIEQADDESWATALFAVAVLFVATALVGYAALRAMGDADDEDDDPGRPR